MLNAVLQIGVEDLHVASDDIVRIVEKFQRMLKTLGKIPRKCRKIDRQDGRGMERSRKCFQDIQKPFRRNAGTRKVRLPWKRTVLVFPNAFTEKREKLDTWDHSGVQQQNIFVRCAILKLGQDRLMPKEEPRFGVIVPGDPLQVRSA